jgi:hypothetical protein
MDEQKELKKELKIINAEIESYNKTLLELDNKEKDLIKASINKTDSR